MSGDGGWACDTSVAVPAVDPNHDAHEACRAALVAHRPVLAGHAAIETYAVLTRLPVPLRVDPTTAAALIEGAFGEPCWPSDDDRRALLRRFASSSLVGGSVYDALVGIAARANERTLLTRDRRALQTYRSLGVEIEVVTG